MWVFLVNGGLQNGMTLFIYKYILYQKANSREILKLMREPGEMFKI